MLCVRSPSGNDPSNHLALLDPVNSEIGAAIERVLLCPVDSPSVEARRLPLSKRGIRPCHLRPIANLGGPAQGDSSADQWMETKRYRLLRAWQVVTRSGDREFEESGR
jgi:hypothetical protein